jgi:hypothetical protein
MKRIQALAIALVVAVFCVIAPAMPQDNNSLTPEHEGMKAPAVNADKLGPPTFSETKDGLTARIWLVSREAYQQLSSGTADDAPGLKGGSPPKPEVALAVLSDDGTKESILQAAVELTIVSPTNKSSLVVLEPRADHYTQELNLAERGTYKFSLKAMHAGKVITMEFKPTFSIL